MHRYTKNKPKPVTFTGTPSGYLRLEQWSAIAERLGLDDRDVLIVRGLIDGETEKAIGDRCDLSAGGVHRCIDLMYRRVDVHDRASFLVRIFLANVLCDREARRKKTKSK